jgi:folate-binding protein YgfZ
MGGYTWVGSDSELQMIREQLTAHALAITPAAYELARLRRARPRFGVDFGEQHYPQEAGLKASVSFQKGCYLGQEVVCTLENRGRLTKQLCALRGTEKAQLVAGSALTTLSGEPVGTITSAAWDPALGANLALGFVKSAYATPSAALLAGTHALTLVQRVGENDAAHAGTST